MYFLTFKYTTTIHILLLYVAVPMGRGGTLNSLLALLHCQSIASLSLFVFLSVTHTHAHRHAETSHGLIIHNFFLTSQYFRFSYVSYDKVSHSFKLLSAFLSPYVPSFQTER